MGISIFSMGIFYGIYNQLQHDDKNGIRNISLLYTSFEERTLSIAYFFWISLSLYCIYIIIYIHCIMNHAEIWTFSTLLGAPTFESRGSWNMTKTMMMTTYDDDGEEEKREQE